MTGETEDLSRLSPFQLLARARAIVGRDALVMRYGERPDMVRMDPERVVVVLSAERGVDIPGGMKVTHRGLRWLTFDLDATTGKWVQAEPVDIMNRLPEPEFHMSYGVKTIAEQAERRAHEDMCYRPGTSACPMDNLPRQRQGFPPPGRNK